MVVRSAVRLVEDEAGVEGTDPALRSNRSMSMKISTGLQDSGTTDESSPKNVEANLNLAELIELHENTDWSDVPGISAAEAGTRMAHLIEVRETIQKGL